MKDNTNVTTIDIDSLDEFFGTTTESVVTTDPPARTVLSVNNDDDVPAPGDATKKDEPVILTTNDSIEIPDLEDPIETPPLNQGRPKTDKSGIIDLFKKKIEAGVMVPFDDYDDKKQTIDEYLASLNNKDFEELWDANIERNKSELEEKVPQEFFSSLPEELKYAAKYVADGGTDLKGLFKALSQVHEVRELDPAKNPREVALQYLKATNYGTEQEINEQLDEWEDLGKEVITKKAQNFKPKLDRMQESMVARRLEEQEATRLQQEAAAENYRTNVVTALKNPEIGGIKLDKKTHDFLTAGLLNAVYPSVSGRNTNLLGHLLEEHQIRKPNYPLIAEATWLLSNPEEYRAKLREQGKNGNVEDTVRKLKGEQQRKVASTMLDEDPRQTHNRNTVQRKNNLFKR